MSEFDSKTFSMFHRLEVARRNTPRQANDADKIGEDSIPSGAAVSRDCGPLVV